MTQLHLLPYKITANLFIAAALGSFLSPVPAELFKYLIHHTVEILPWLIGYHNVMKILTIIEKYMEKNI